LGIVEDVAALRARVAVLEKVAELSEMFLEIEGRGFVKGCECTECQLRTALDAAKERK
jgi:hypothetical protein